jgi:hypothetical protein
VYGDAGLRADGVAAEVLLDVQAPVAPAEARVGLVRELEHRERAVRILSEGLCPALDRV